MELGEFEPQRGRGDTDDERAAEEPQGLGAPGPPRVGHLVPGLDEPPRGGATGHAEPAKGPADEVSDGSRQPASIVGHGRQSAVETGMIT